MIQVEIHNIKCQQWQYKKTIIKKKKKTRVSRQINLV